MKAGCRLHELCHPTLARPQSKQWQVIMLSQQITVAGSHKALVLLTYAQGGNTLFRRLYRRSYLMTSCMIICGVPATYVSSVCNTPERIFMMPDSYL